jgi:acetyl esterase
MQIDPAALRAEEESHVPPLEDRVPVGPVEDTTYAGVPVRLYGSPTAAVVVYVHGGAFFLGSLETHDHVARELADATGRRVVSVGYRRAPEAAYPAGLDDCYAVVRHVVEQGGTVALVGDSSGGNFVAAVAALAHDRGLAGITHQVLLYPSLDLDFDAALSSGRYPSLVENAVGHGLETAGLKPFNAFYVDSGADPADPLVSPIKRTDLAGLPPALVVTAEHDPLRDEGERYGERLREAGVDATVSRYAGAGHGFVQHQGTEPGFHRVYDEIAAFLS